MAAETTTTKVELLKKLWGDKVYAPVYGKCKFIYKCRKNKNFGGELRYVIVENSPLAGASSDMATAIANEAAGVDKRFSVYRRKEYVSFSIENELYLAAQNKGVNAVIAIMQQKSKQALYKHARAAASRAWGNGGGSIGRIDSTTTLASTTLILDNPVDITRYEVGMKLQFAEDDGTPASPAGLRASTALTVNGVPTKGTAEDGTTLTLSANLSTVSNIAVGDYIFRQGDYANAMTGVPGWNPTTAPSGGESFMGVDRTVGDTQRLIGYISPVGASTTYEQKLVRAAMAGKTFGVDDIKHCWVNPIDFGEIALEVGSAKQTMVEDKTYGISFDTIRINGPDGAIEVIADADVPRGFYWMNNMETWELFSLGDFPMELTDNGGKWLMYKEAADEHRGRLGSYANFLNENPGNSIQGAF
jgi:hypothetical protein